MQDFLLKLGDLDWRMANNKILSSLSLSPAWIPIPNFIRESIYVKLLTNTVFWGAWKTDGKAIGIYGWKDLLLLLQTKQTDKRDGIRQACSSFFGPRHYIELGTDTGNPCHFFCPSNALIKPISNGKRFYWHLNVWIPVSTWSGRGGFKVAQ